VTGPSCRRSDCLKYLGPPLMGEQSGAFVERTEAQFSTLGCGAWPFGCWTALPSSGSLG
jgi:hypothetical protein